MKAASKTCLALLCALPLAASAGCDWVGQPAQVGVVPPSRDDLMAWDANLTRANAMMDAGDKVGAGSVLGELRNLMPPNDPLRAEQYRAAADRQNGMSAARPVIRPVAATIPATEPAAEVPPSNVEVIRPHGLTGKPAGR